MESSAKVIHHPDDLKDSIHQTISRKPTSEIPPDEPGLQKTKNFLSRRKKVVILTCFIVVAIAIAFGVYFGLFYNKKTSYTPPKPGEIIFANYTTVLQDRGNSTRRLEDSPTELNISCIFFNISHNSVYSLGVRIASTL